MELPEEQYYRLNRIFLSTIGLWPYDNLKTRYIRLILWLLLILSFIGSQWLKIYVSKYNSDIILTVLSYNFTFTIACIKFVSFYAVSENIKEFRARVRSNWNALNDNQEIKIICKHGLYGKLVTIFITVCCGSLITAYLFIQYYSVIFDIIMPLNTSRSRKLLFEAEYFIDVEKNFFVLSIHICIAVLAVVMCITATESFSLANALHAFGLFRIASYRMKHILKEINPHMCVTKKYIISRNRIMAAVDFHKRAIEFSELLKTSFGPAYLVLFILGVCSASINLFHMSRIIMTDEREIFEIIKSIVLIIIHIIYLTLANYAGQEFINCDTLYYNTIRETEWYNAPIKTQKLILFVLRKTTKCYKVDAGGMFIPCLEGLATSLSMSVSYFMVLYSV